MQGSRFGALGYLILQLPRDHCQGIKFVFTRASAVGLEASQGFWASFVISKMPIVDPNPQLQPFSPMPQTWFWRPCFGLFALRLGCLEGFGLRPLVRGRMSRCREMRFSFLRVLSGEVSIMYRGQLKFLLHVVEGQHPA